MRVLKVTRSGLESVLIGTVYGVLLRVLAVGTATLVDPPCPAANDFRIFRNLSLS